MRLTTCVFVLGALTTAGCDPASSETDAGPPAPPDAGAPREPAALPDVPDGYVRHEVDRLGDGPAFSSVADLDGDGRLDIVTGHLGHPEGPNPPPGRVTAYLQGADLDSWESVDVVPLGTDLPFANEPTLEDVDLDGDIDIIVPSGFLVCTLFSRECGGLVWFENGGNARTWTQHDIVTPGDRLFYHRAVFVDFDGDEIGDLVTAGEFFSSSSSEAQAMWFRGTADADRFETTPRVIGEGGGSLPQVIDVDGDGDLDLASAEFFVEGRSAVWFERVGEPSTAEPAGRFEAHVIEAEVGPSIQLELIEQDGHLFAILANHTSVHREEPESGVFLYEVPEGDAVREPWTRTQISEGIESRPDTGLGRHGAPGIFDAGDFDQDGDLDVLLSGDGDEQIYLLVQDDGSWRTEVLQANLGQAGSTQIIDLDGDGDFELLASGYEADSILIYDAL